jgi:hypothetical protein
MRRYELNYGPIGICDSIEPGRRMSCYGSCVGVRLSQTHRPAPKWYIGRYEAAVEWYWQGKTEGLREKPVPAPVSATNSTWAHPGPRSNKGYNSRSLTALFNSKSTVITRAAIMIQISTARWRKHHPEDRRVTGRTIVRRLAGRAWATGSRQSRLHGAFFSRTMTLYPYLDGLHPVA